MISAQVINKIVKSPRDVQERFLASRPENQRETLKNLIEYHSPNSVPEIGLSFVTDSDIMSFSDKYNSDLVGVVRLARLFEGGKEYTASQTIKLSGLGRSAANKYLGNMVKAGILYRYKPATQSAFFYTASPDSERPPVLSMYDLIIDAAPRGVSFTLSDIADRVGASKSSIDNNFRRMIAEGKIERMDAKFGKSYTYRMVK